MAALVDERARIVDSVDIPVSVFTPDYGFVEQDPAELVESIRSGARQLMEKNRDKLDRLTGVAVANQGESFLLWDKNTGVPVTPVVSWQDSRCGSLCKRLHAEDMDRWFNQRTGLHLSNEWPAMKLRFMRESDAEFDALCAGGTLAYGQLDAWFLFSLSHGAHYASDHSTASRSGFYHVETLSWDAELLDFFKAGGIAFPRLADNTECFPGIDLGIGKILPWLAGGLDQSMAMLGQRCNEPRSAKVTYGTCCSCWMNLGKELVLDDKLTSSVAWKHGDEIVYGLAAEGGSSGSIITWLQRNFKTGWKTSELSDIAKNSDDQPGLVFVPAFNGISAPYWEDAVRGTMFGVTAGTKPEHILRAGLDAIAYTVRDMLDVMPACEKLIVDGGMTANDYLMQKQADVLGRPIWRNANSEGTITGAAMLALMGLHAGEPYEPPPAEESARIDPRSERNDEGYLKWKEAEEASIKYYTKEKGNE